MEGLESNISINRLKLCFLEKHQQTKAKTTELNHTPIISHNIIEQHTNLDTNIIKNSSDIQKQFHSLLNNWSNKKHTQVPVA